MTDGAEVRAVPRPGDASPGLELPDTYGTPVSLEALRGTPVCVVFLPLAFSLTCTSELRDLRDHGEEFERAGARLLVVTCDAVPTLRAWAEREGVGGADDGTGIDLLSDFWPHGAAAREFGAFDDVTGAPRRVSVLLDGDGIVRWTTTARPGHPRDIAEYLVALSAL